MFAITPRGIGRPVGWRAIREGWPLAAGETFTVAGPADEELVLAENETSLRAREAGDPPLIDLGSDFDLDIQTDRLLRLLFEVMFDHENRLRTLEGRPTLTRPQALQGLKNMYKTLNGS